MRQRHRHFCPKYIKKMVLCWRGLLSCIATHLHPIMKNEIVLELCRARWFTHGQCSHSVLLCKSRSATMETPLALGKNAPEVLDRAALLFFPEGSVLCACRDRCRKKAAMSCPSCLQRVLPK